MTSMNADEERNESESGKMKHTVLAFFKSEHHVMDMDGIKYNL